MTQEQKNVLETIVHYRNAMGRGTSRNTTALTFAEIYASYSLLVQENEKHEKFTRWLIGGLIKGELDEEAVMDKLVEFGFAECKDGYITIKVEI